MTTEHTPLTLRLLAAADCERIAEAFARQGWNKPAAQYARYFEEQEGGQREVWVAEWAGDFAGYVTVVWESDYAPFRVAAIPEIVDLNVLKCYQQQGIGSALIQRAEKRIGKRSPLAGIGVGLTADYGPAQRLYALLGYRPDGRGISQHGAPAAYGATVTVDDDLVLYMTRRVKPKRNRGTAIVETAQGILLASTHDGLFLLPGGGVEPGETHLEATLREFARGDRPARRVGVLPLRTRDQRQPAQGLLCRRARRAPAHRGDATTRVLSRRRRCQPVAWCPRHLAPIC